MSCQHINLVFIPLTATSLEQADAQWCADCGQLKAKNEFSFLEPGTDNFLIFHPADSIDNEPQSHSGMTQPYGRTWDVKGDGEVELC